MKPMKAKDLFYNKIRAGSCTEPHFTACLYASVAPVSDQEMPCFSA